MVASVTRAHVSVGYSSDRADDEGDTGDENWRALLRKMS
jgi:hypothetical protein